MAIDILKYIKEKKVFVDDSVYENMSEEEYSLAEYNYMMDNDNIEYGIAYIH